MVFRMLFLLLQVVMAVQVQVTERVQVMERVQLATVLVQRMVLVQLDMGQLAMEPHQDMDRTSICAVCPGMYCFGFHFSGTVKIIEGTKMIASATIMFPVV
jgi:hypothetical protein